ncbi:hypothetical protein DSECCO2_576930 [anaerobic digester metagenome]
MIGTPSIRINVLACSLPTPLAETDECLSNIPIFLVTTIPETPLRISSALSTGADLMLWMGIFEILTGVCSISLPVFVALTTTSLRL